MKLMTNNLKMFIFLSLLLTYSELFSQGNESYMNIIPPSPNASELGKYIDIPVNLYTGIPTITIPLFEIKGRDISIPITLSYHASGVKVEQMATSVGLGWSLNAGGVITRTVRGAPDDRWEDSNDPSKFCKGFFYSSGILWGILSSSATPEGIAINAWRVSQGGWDTEPDMYYYNFSNHQGQFFFDQAKNIYFTSKNDLAITCAMEENQPITGFSIADEKGIKYLFDKVEITDDNSTLGYPFNSSWYLTKIQSQFENIDFEYQDEEIFEKKTRSQVRIYVNEGGEISTTPRFGFTPEIRIKCKRLSRIDWSGGYIIFESSTVRLDVGHHASDTKYSKALDKIYAYTTQGVLIKQYNLNYSYFNGTSCSSEPTEGYLCKRLKLNSITEVNGAASKPPYTFSYDETSLSPRNSFQQDYWGYFNGNDASTIIPKVWAYPSDYNNPLYKSGYSIYRRSSFAGTEYELPEGADRSPVEAKMKAGILNKIIYPTGGFLELEYESHKFFFDNANREGGGLRVKNTRFKEDVNGNIIQENYDYTFSNDPIKSSGSLLYIPQFALERVNLDITISDLNSLKRKTMLYTTSLGGLGEAQGSHFGYKEVTISQLDNGKRITKFDMPGVWEKLEDDCINGDCIFKRTDAISTFGIGIVSINFIEKVLYFPKLADKDNYPYAPNPNYDWNRGQITEELFFKESDLVNPIKKITYNYAIKDHNKFYAVKSQSLGGINSYYYDPVSKRKYPFVYNFSKIAKYYNLSAWKVLTGKKEYDYDRADRTKYTLKETSYKYDSPSHRQITEMSTVNSDGSVIKTVQRYLNDVFTYTGQPYDEIYRAFAIMNSKNMISNPIETITYKDDKAISSNVLSFKEFPIGSGKVFPNVSFALESKNPIGSSSYILSTVKNPYAPILMDPNLKPKVYFDNYDDKGNLLQFHPANRINTSYIWGYNKTQPIAEVKNANSSEIFFTSYEEDGDFSGLAYKCTTDSHSGSQCDFVPPGGFNKAIDFPKSNLHGKYVYSAWIKTIGSGTYISIKDFTNATTRAYSSTSVPNTYGQWKYFEAVANLDDASYNGSNNIRVEVWNSGSTATYVDDVRFRPFSSQMSTYTYKPLVGVTSVTDNLNRTTTYEYDDFGRLKTTKDESGYILNHYEYRYYLPNCTLGKTNLGNNSFQYDITGSEFNGADYTYEWNFGDGTAISNSLWSMNHTYSNTSGNYTVSIKILSNGNIIKTLTTTCNSIGNVILTASQSGQCLNDFYISGTNFTPSSYTYDWDFGDGEVENDYPYSSNSHYYNQFGFYTVTVNIKYEGVVVKTLQISVECVDNGGGQLQQ